MNGNKSKMATLEKHYRVTMDFRVLAKAITSEVCRESFFFNDESDSSGAPASRENIERQRRLYKLLRNNRQVLEHYLLSVLIQEAGRFAYEGLTDAFDAQAEDELLMLLYKGMAEEDARFFEECRELGALAENTELITMAFKVEWLTAEIGEMNRRVVGDIKRAEIMERTKTRLIKKLNSPY